MSVDIVVLLRRKGGRGLLVLDGSRFVDLRRKWILECSLSFGIVRM